MNEEEAPPIYDSDPNEDTSWLVTYGDMVTLLMVFFVLMFSASKINEEKYDLVAQSINQGFDSPGPDASINPTSAASQAVESPLEEAKAKFDGATQALFHILKGLSKSKDGVAPKSFLKLAKETKMIDDKRIKLNTCDLAVSKAKGISKANGTGTGAGNLTHAELVYALQYLANKKYPKLESLRRHEGDDARFNKFCYEFIFTNGRGNAIRHGRKTSSSRRIHNRKTRPRKLCNKNAIYS